MNVANYHAMGIKLAAVRTEEEKPETSWGKVLGKTLLGMGAGTLAGYLGPKAISHGLQSMGHPGIPKGPIMQYGLPFIGAAMGGAVPLMHSATSRAMGEALENKRKAYREKQEQKLSDRPNS